METAGRDEFTQPGTSANGHLTELVSGQLRAMGVMASGALPGLADGSKVWVGGVLVASQRPPTTKGVAFLAIEDAWGLVNVVLRPEVYQASRGALWSWFVVGEGVLHLRTGRSDQRAGATGGGAEGAAVASYLSAAGGGYNPGRVRGIGCPLKRERALWWENPVPVQVNTIVLEYAAYPGDGPGRFKERRRFALPKPQPVAVRLRAAGLPCRQRRTLREEWPRHRLFSPADWRWVWRHSQRS